MSAAETWLRERLPGAPAHLLEAMVEALPAGADGVADSLAEGAMTLYGAVRNGGGGREDALPLLAADALLTHAFEAQAEQDPSRLAAFAERWGGAGRLAELAG